MNRLSKVFRPFNLPPKRGILDKLISKSEMTSKGHQLLYAYGYIRHNASGMFHVLPMGQRVLDKLTRLIDREMKLIGAEKMSLPFLSNQKLWETSKTYERSKEELYHVVDREGTTFILNPTYEQAFSHLLSNELLSYRDFPRLLYQISPKFRDEHKPKAGLLRTKEFLMKDLYSFDISEEEATKSYAKVSKAYEKIFSTLGITAHRADSAPESSVIKAHEYFYICDVGDDKIFCCPACKNAFLNEALKDRNTCPGCSRYKKDENFFKGVEVAHTFYFGTYYSDHLGSYYVNVDCQRSPLHMCSYGIGISRLLSATAELLCTADNELRWPVSIAPYSVCIIPPKAGSREEVMVDLVLPDIYHMLDSIPSLRDDIVIDDHNAKTIGKRFLEAKLFGFPFIVVAGKDATQQTPLFEVHDVNNKAKYLMPASSLVQFLLDKTKPLTEESRKTWYIVGDR